MRSVGALFAECSARKSSCERSIGAEREGLTLVIKRPVGLGEPVELSSTLRRLATCN